MAHAKKGGHRRRGGHEEEHENHERWLVSYADMVTLLMCLFIVLFAMSQVDKAKFAALSQGLSEGFGAPMAILDHGDARNDPTLAFAQPAPLDIAKDAGAGAGTGVSEKAQKEQQAAEMRYEAQRKARIAREAQATYDEFVRVRTAINEALRNAGYPNAARFDINERGLVVSIVTDRVLFDSASADLLPAGQRILAAISPALRGLPNTLAIEGHTNQLPLMPGTQWPSDWELSAYRATTVLRYMATEGGIDDTKMHASAFSDNEPLVDPARPEAVERNRRVDILVMSMASGEANALLPSLDEAEALTAPTAEAEPAASADSEAH